MKPWNTWILVCLQIILIQQTQSSINVNLCCSQLDILDITKNQCKTHNYSQSLVSNFVNSDISVNKGTHLPACGSRDIEKFSLKLKEGIITSEGQLVTKKYGKDYLVTDFCLTASDNSDDVFAVTCNPCSTGQKKCINLCCPHGQVFMPNPDYDYYSENDQEAFICSKPEDTGTEIKYDTQIHDLESEDVLQWERNEQYLLVGLDKPTCPPGFDGHAFVPEDVGEFNVVSNGSLRGTGLPGLGHGNGTRTVYWRPDEYCMVVGDIPDYDYSYDDEDSDYTLELKPKLKLTFMHCLEEEKLSWEESFTSIFHPIALSISVIFMILVLLVFVSLKSLRETIIGKLTIGFITNLICCYICIIDNYVKDSDPKGYDRRETAACIFTGYAILYFFHAYFFWVNAMAVQIWFSFTNMIQINISEKSRFLFLVLYSQGIPAILCILTAIIDNSASSQGKLGSLYYPEIGVYSCYLRGGNAEVKISYFQSPIFIYQQSILILTMVVNIILFTHVCYTVFRTKQAENGLKRQYLIHQFSTFIKIFVVLGFTWISELISTGLHIEQYQQTFYARLFLDIINLFLGVLLFLLLVCNKQVLHRLKSRTLNNSQQELKMSEMERTMNDM